MSRGGVKPKQRTPRQTQFRVTRATLIDGTVIEASTVRSRDGEKEFHNLWWDSAFGGLAHYDEGGNTFYPAGSVRETRWDAPSEEAD